MKKSCLTTIFLCTVLFPTCAPAPEQESETSSAPVFNRAVEEAAIRQVESSYNDAWNRHDAKAAAAFFAKDYAPVSEKVSERPANHEKSLAAVFDRHKEHQRKLLEEIGIVFITPDAAIYKGWREVSGWVDNNGKLMPPGNQLFLRVFRKENGKWLAVTSFSRLEEDPSASHRGMVR